ncbi:peroxiredoxin-like family protein [Oharaeibacter diazotrophicus]|uniref:thioredoxin-dependent peroxiredoxin n=1 Tax=Oharaeibacter diazotrophicus TaxID=1920512 RepID=A0A4R6RN70_9HYPH|nr:peroxiredoxin-like family protein [Oharaeibacter diazotrophicus]TDP87256.1 peroxiredoxin [Oharaeibacter diazotrophicus]BBE70801.1 putative peroxiredoxin/MT2597 [Pleomorphomonas sp. SM30]GLS77549.1 peroxiredoxin [Oharaeibacter diazotrophicus]
MTLQDKLDAYRTDFETKAPADALGVMRRATADLAASGILDGVLRPGALAPTFTLPDSEGVELSSAHLLARGPLVVTFYRGIWCPYCNIDLRELGALTREIAALGATLVAISPQSTTNGAKTRRDLGLDFPVLHDAGNAVAALFGLRFRLADELIALYQGFGVDLPKVNGEPSWTLPMPARFVIAADGRIAYAETDPDYTRRPEPTAFMDVLRGLRAGV